MLSLIDSLLELLSERVSLVELLLVSKDTDSLFETEAADCVLLSLVLKLSLVLLLPDPELKLTVSLFTKF
ncbi:hypothetical protein [Ligilactobacillus salivarius]|uniref:hypothetical protein n=1 Tax=Ligilactobacillus salivarius TaxID=1624 RepID=UPI001CDB083F|nr:hypothetical protein [Ligilactobacillus salivarius]UDE97329.1 hypothetical protein LG631_00290 [Ligilactobacillus salivarius]UUV96449.1 hypothetical protein M3M92_00290 [Ligilactobacillus salivarius]